MKYRFSVVILIAAAIGFMLWGCSSQTQDPVSSISTVGSASPQILHKSILTPTNLLAVVNGKTVTISWDSVAYATSYRVVIISAGDTSLNEVQTARQLVVPNLQPGNYSVLVAAIVTGDQGSFSGAVLFSVSSVVAPTVTAIASPLPICFRNREWVTVTFSGIVVNAEGGASYELKDEYNKIHYTVTVPAGSYAVKLNLKDRSIWFDTDGRQYTFKITATNSAGTAKASVTVTVPRDRNFWNWKDDDGWDDHR